MPVSRFVPAGFRCPLALAFALLALSPALADNLPDLGDASQAELSPQMERRIGQSVLNEYRTEPNFVDDVEIVGYVNRIGQKLASHLDDTSQSFRFFVLRDPTINAFAMPGGYIGVHTGLIAAVESESELAGVLAHEISHVTQHHLARAFARQDRETVPMMAAMVLAILAARNSSAGMGGMAALTAGNIQSELSYSRAYEQEADRMGLQLLDRSGYDVRGMETFFQRLLRFSRLYESNAPGYLRTHPLTTDRIADMGNRIEHMQKRTLPDSLDLRLVQAKILATDGQGRDDAAIFQAELRDKAYRSEVAAWYGLALSQLRALDPAGAAQALAELRRCQKSDPKAASPMIETLAAQIQQRQGKVAGAEATLRAALRRWPESRATSYALIGLLQDTGRHDAALSQVKYDQQYWPHDAQLYLLKAKSYAAQGKRLLQHKALAEAYALRGQLTPAIEQLMLAQKAPDGDFFEYSQVDASLHELKQKKADEAADKF